MRELSTLTLLRRAVKAKAQYWDATRALEQRIAKSGDYNNRQDEKAEHMIELFASGLVKPEDANQITKNELGAFIKSLE